MEKGEGPPPDIADIPYIPDIPDIPDITNIPDIADIPAPPYPGPPLDSSVVIIQPTPVDQPVTQLHPQQYQQPVDQKYPQVDVQQHQQPVNQPNIQLAQQQAVPQNQTTQPATPVVVVQARPTEAPGSMLCPHCKTTVVRPAGYKLGLLMWIFVGTLFIIGCWPCCLIPSCVGACKDAQRSCPKCNRKALFRGYRRM